MPKFLKKGFTLIELLVVISIIGILATLLVANFNSARERARDAKRKSDVKNIATNLRLYYNDFGFYPASDSAHKIVGCGDGRSSCEWGQSWEVNGATYMTTIPKEPLNSQGYYYERTDLDNFVMRACLENKSDEGGKAASGVSGWGCPSGWVFEVRS